MKLVTGMGDITHASLEEALRAMRERAEDRILELVLLASNCQ